MSSKVIQQLEVTFMLMVCQIIGLNFTIAEEDGYNGNDHSGVDFNVLDSVKYFQATGSMLPRLGIGLLDVETKEERLRVLDWAFKLGYRMLDVWEGDETAIADAIEKSGIPRTEIYLILKLNQTTRDIDGTRESIFKALENLHVPYLDLVLINYPDYQEEYLSTWRTLIELKHRGYTRSIGVSNFNEQHVLRLYRHTGILPSVVQLEVHPYFQQKELIHNLTARGIIVQAYSPLAAGKALNESSLLGLAKNYNKSAAQVLIQWCLKKNFSCITKSTKREHLAESINAAYFHLSHKDIEFLDSFDEHFVTNFDPTDEKHLAHVYKYYINKSRQARLDDDETGVEVKFDDEGNEITPGEDQDDNSVQSKDGDTQNTDNQSNVNLSQPDSSKEVESYASGDIQEPDQTHQTKGDYGTLSEEDPGHEVRDEL